MFGSWGDEENSMSEKSTVQYAVVDEVEEGVCVVLFDAGWKLHMKRETLPAGTKEGTVLKVTFEVDAAEQARRVSEIQDIQTRLLNRTLQRGK
jgi:hypothetical protein